MHALTLYTDGIGGIALHGAAVVAPVEGARREAAPAVLANGKVEEIITVGLKGSGIKSWIRALEEQLSLAREGRRQVSLSLQLNDGETALSSQVTDGWIELAGYGTADRDHGYQGLKVHLIRADWWQDSQRAVKLQNQNGTDIWSGLTIYNHKDSTTGHENFIDIKASELPGSMGAPATIRLEVAASPARRVQDVIIAGGADLWDDYGGLNNVLEGESGTQGAGVIGQSTQANSSASGGNYRVIDWNSTSEVQLWKWDLIPSRLGYLGAKAYRPVIRMHELMATEGVYLRWKLARRDGGGALEQTGQVKVSTSRRMIVTPAVSLPALKLGSGPYETVTLELWAECITAGTKRLRIDFVQLLPVEEWAHLQAIGGTNENFALLAHGEREQVYSEALVGGGSQAVSHVLTGRFINLQPGKNSRIYFLFETNAGMPVDDTLKVLVYTKARYRTP
jgi:hypothetical protein